MVSLKGEEESEQPVRVDTEVNNNPGGKVHRKPSQQQLEEGGQDEEVYQEDAACLPHHRHTERSHTRPGILIL